MIPNSLLDNSSASKEYKMLGRGRGTEALWQIPSIGWVAIFCRAWKNTGEQRLSLVAAGVAYYLLLALFPAVAAFVSSYGLVENPADVTRHVRALSSLLPASTVNVIGNELHQIVSASNNSLGFGAVVGILIALWSSLRGMAGMMSALNIAYHQPERRGFLKYNVTALLLTMLVLVGGTVALIFIVALPIVLHRLGAHHPIRWVGLLIEWPLLVLFFMGAVALIYRYGPDHDERKNKHTAPGVIAATILWITASSLFSFYVYHFNSYDKAYGALGALLVLLIWLWLSAFVVLFGAEVNGETERHLQRHDA
jgi:membrane protein